jgi:small subunit ribosomal protein S11
MSNRKNQEFEGTAKGGATSMAKAAALRKAKRRAKRLRVRAKVLTRLRRARFAISLSKRNVFVCLTDGRGNVLAWSTGGCFGFEGSKRATPVAARFAGLKIAQKAVDRGVREAEICVNGFGRGRRAAIRAIGGFKVRNRKGREIVAFKIKKLVDFTRVPHNGCRLPRRRHIRRRNRRKKRTLLAPFTTKRYMRAVRTYNRYPPRKTKRGKKTAYPRKMAV